MQQCTEKIFLLHRSLYNMGKGMYDGGIISQLGLMASFASIFGSLYIYFVADDQTLGIFVGLWAPTLLLLSDRIEEILNE